jgi:hypothetical protein
VLSQPDRATSKARAASVKKAVCFIFLFSPFHRYNRDTPGSGLYRITPGCPGGPAATQGFFFFNWYKKGRLRGQPSTASKTTMPRWRPVFQEEKYTNEDTPEQVPGFFAEEEIAD